MGRFFQRGIQNSSLTLQNGGERDETARIENGTGKGHKTMCPLRWQNLKDRGFDCSGNIPDKSWDSEDRGNLFDVRGKGREDCDMSERLPCPFCGCKKTTTSKTGEDYYVECVDCDARGGAVFIPLRPTQEDFQLIEKYWNRRA